MFVQSLSQIGPELIALPPGIRPNGSPHASFRDVPAHAHAHAGARAHARACMLAHLTHLEGGQEAGSSLLAIPWVATTWAARYQGTSLAAGR